MAGQAWTGANPADITAWTLVGAGHVAGRAFTEALAETGVSPTQFGTLLQLDLHPDVANAELARLVLVTPQAMSELLTGLERAGLVTRDTSMGPGRRTPVRLTPAGRHTLVRCAQAVDRVERSLGLTDADRRRLNALLHRITKD